MQALRGRKVPKGRKEKRAHKVRKGKRALQGHKVPRARRAMQVRRGRPDHKAHPAPRVQAHQQAFTS
jgi:hypothetical protein